MSDSDDTSTAGFLFAASMPQLYRSLWDDEQRELHARIVERSGTALVHVECFDGPPVAAFHVQWLCLVADDCPGLLSLITAAILAHSLDVVGADAYCRPGPHGVQAIDFFAVRALKSATVLEVDTRGIAATVEALLLGRTTLQDLARNAAPTTPPLGASRPTHPRVDFASNEMDLLVVESRDRSGLLLSITLALASERLTILSSTVKTSGGVARDQFVLAEHDGTRLTSERRRAIVQRIRGVLVIK